ncbi:MULTISPECIES: hypothetical protein [unclassified Streptomyces]|uniref:hypothetical protein n=1 Tax=unclassified Streptomyces TaxID=2593676 RepID=UPI001F0504DF|nr:MULTISPECIES: hypothetical protein [unclassified Streptomyces]MCH0567079.1 hypothetical protein [Streptomyces sp. MUM 2J]MCH0573201.1 hypothetical protein [Streptomyces sp. MUM 136J]
MGDTVRRSSVPRQEPPAMPRLALHTLIVCVLAVAAAVVSFVQGSWLGVVWLLLAGVSSNMTWYYVRQGRSAHQNR